MTTHQRTIGIVLGLVLAGMAGGVALDRWRTAPEVTVGPTVGGVTPIVVNAPALTPSVVTKYVRDTAEVSRLLNEQAAAKREIATLTETIATLRTQGSGPVTYIDRPGPAVPPRDVRFDDGRLRFDLPAGGDQASYALRQTFEAITTVGKDKAGKPTASVRLFEVWPGETRTALTNATTVLVSANPGAPRWRASLAIQAGAAYGVTTDLARGPGAVVGIQWLKRGSSRAAEDNTVAALTPVVFLATGTQELGLLPVSVNLGRVPHQPFKDLWLSPVVTRHRAGVALTGTF